MKKLNIILIMIFPITFLNSQQSFDLQVFPTEASIGIVLQLNAEQDIATPIKLDFRQSGQGHWQEAHPLVPVRANQWAGALFQLVPGNDYGLRINGSNYKLTVENEKIDWVARTQNVETSGLTVNHYYVAPNGSNLNSGSQNQPYQTIQNAVDRASAGDMIHVLPGTYYQHTSIDHGGVADKYLVIRAEGKVVLDGADQTLAQTGGEHWEWYQAPAIYRAAVDWSPCGVYFEGQQLYRYSDFNELTSLPVGNPGGWLWRDNFLFLHLSNQHDPDQHQIQVTKLASAFHLEKVNYVIIDGFEIQYFGNGEYGKGIYLKNAADCIIRNNHLHHIRYGVWVKGKDAHRNLIKNNSIWDTAVYKWPWEAVKGGWHENAGLILEGGEGNVICQNEISGFFDGIAASFWQDLNDRQGNFNTDIYENRLYHIGDDGIELEGACMNMKVWGNQISDCLVGISLAPITVGPTFVWRNVIVDFALTSFKLASNTAGPCFLYHNTAYTSLPAINGLTSSGAWKNVTLRNNIIIGTAYAIEDFHLNGVADFDYDNLYSTDPARFVRWKGTRYHSPSEFFQRTGQEEHGISAASHFCNLSARNFQLSRTCPEIDRGVKIPNFNDDFLGEAPDIGAFEFDPQSAVEEMVTDKAPSNRIQLACFPNPFNCEVAIKYTLSNLSRVNLKIFNCNGQLIQSRLQEAQPVGSYQVKWTPAGIASGIYWIDLRTAEERVSQKVLYLK